MGAGGCEEGRGGEVTDWRQVGRREREREACTVQVSERSGGLEVTDWRQVEGREAGDRWV